MHRMIWSTGRVGETLLVELEEGAEREVLECRKLARCVSLLQVEVDIQVSLSLFYSGVSMRTAAV